MQNIANRMDVYWKDPRAREAVASLIQSLDSIYSVDLNQEVLYAPFESQDGAGSPQQEYREAVRRYIQAEVVPEDREFCLRRMDPVKVREELFRNGKLDFEYRALKKDGRIRWTRCCWLPSRWGENGQLETATLISSDIHREKTLEQQLKARQEQSKRQLREEQLRMRILAEATSAIVISYDVEQDQARVVRNMRERDGSVRFLEMERTNLYQDWKEIVDARYLKQFVRMFQKGKDLGKSYEILARMQHEKRYHWYRVRGNGVYNEHRKLIRVVVATLDNIDREKKQALRLMRKSETDPATGLFNRRALERRMSARLEEAGCHVFLILDLDRFKLINDTYGHLEGDRVLCQCAVILKEIFRSEALVARLGGDEFCIYCKCPDGDTKNIQVRAEKICRQISNTIRERSAQTGCSCSIGITMCKGGEKDFYQMYREADSALYAQKKRGRDGYCFYEELQ